MSEENVSEELEAVEPQESERESLELRAKQLGIKFHPSIGNDKLRDKVNEELDKPTEGIEDAKTSGPVSSKSRRSEAMALKRIRVTCMNPNKKEWEGEMFTVGNSVVGTMRKFVQFEVEYHVPQIVLNMIKQRQYQTFVTRKTPNGGKVKVGKLVKEFAVEELEPLSEKEMAELKQRQVMAAGQAEAA